MAPRLESLGFVCELARPAGSSPQPASAGSPDVIVALEEAGGWSRLRRMIAAGPPIIVVAASASPADRAEALASSESGVRDWVESSCTDRELAARINHLAGVRRMQIEIEELTRRCAEMETVDRLTGLPNHRAFHECLGKEVRRAERYNSPLSLVLIDIRQFRAINDTYGHLWGDRVLQDLARRFRELLRTTDLICRYGGDELAMLLPETDMAAAEAVADRVRRMVAMAAAALRDRLPAAPRESAIPFDLSVSLGVACTQAESASTSTPLLESAEAALRRAKDAGRERAAPPISR